MNSSDSWIIQGQTTKDFVFLPDSQSALPPWLTTVGTSPILTFSNPADANRGAMNLQTKAAIPTSGDIAGISTLSLVTGAYSEIGFFVSGITPDNLATSTNCSLALLASDGSINYGVFSSNQTDNGKARFTVYPAAAADHPWPWMNSGVAGSDTTPNARKRKGIGMVVRPASNELWITTGDPAKGEGGIIAYSNAFTNSTMAFLCRIVTTTAAQRSMNISKVSLRLSQW